MHRDACLKAWLWKTASQAELLEVTSWPRDNRECGECVEKEVACVGASVLGGALGGVQVQIVSGGALQKYSEWL